MDKLVHIISTITSMDIFWSGIGLYVMLWPDLFFHEAGLSEKDLVKILPRHKGISDQFYLYGFLWFISTYLPMMALTYLLTRWLSVKQDLNASVGILFAQLAVYRGLFALVKGVYPTGRFIRYMYNDTARIRRIGKLQVLIALGAEAVALLAFAVSLLGGQ